MTIIQTELKLAEMIGMNITSSYYDGYVWFLSEDEIKPDHYLRIDFPEYMSWNDSYAFTTNEICISLIDIDSEIIDSILL